LEQLCKAKEAPAAPHQFLLMHEPLAKTEQEAVSEAQSLLRLK
jgi:hypothetical protein